MDEVLRAWSWPGEVRAVRHAVGLINETWWVDGDGGRLAVLQRLNTRIFRPEVHEDIEVVTARVAERGLLTPRLLRTRAGGLWATSADGGVWRCLTVVGDRTIEKLADPADAREAARLLAAFHAAVRDLDWSFRMVRPGVHDTAAHMARLAQALDVYRDHRLYGEVAPLAEGVLAAWTSWRGPADLPGRVVHGDPKISNVRFAGAVAVAMVDLDTLQRSTLDLELGDAMRSWCNPLAEDTADGRFELPLFEAAMRGYAGGADGVSDAEWDAIVPAVERIALELAARFAQDALAESYFGFDPRWGGRGEHNLLRARGQAGLARSVRAQAGEAARIVQDARRMR